MDMKLLPSLLVCCLVFLFSADPASAQSSAAAPAAKPSGHAAKKELVVAPDLAARIARFRPVKMPFDADGLSPRERQLVETLVAASHYLEDINWRQTDPEGLKLYLSLAGKTDERSKELRELLWIQGSRFDLLEENEPFVGTEPAPPGGGFYPPGLTREDIEAYVARHPDQREAIYSGYTIIHRKGDKLETVPYHVAYRAFLKPAAKALREAAGFSDDPAFAKFLRARADALLSDDYYPSDLLWMDLDNPKFDVIFAPYETYTDGVLGVKTSYGAAVLIRNEEESAKLEVFQKYVSQIQEALPLAPEDLPSMHGRRTPMEVMDTPFRAGDLRHGYQAVADNLPNDARIHEEKGSKKIFFKNFMDARVNNVILPIAQRLMQSDQAARASAEGYLAHVMMHEICHGLGPTYARRNGEKIDIREAIGPAYSALEEAKADVVGMFALEWLVDHGALPRERLPEYYASYLAGIFRTVRFGTGEAHGRAEMMEFNYYVEKGAVGRDAETGRYEIDYAKIPGAIASLAKELLEMEATGDRDRVEKWFARYDQMPRELEASLHQATDIPVDIAPEFSFPEPLR